MQVQLFCDPIRCEYYLEDLPEGLVIKRFQPWQIIFIWKNNLIDSTALLAK